MVVVGKPYIVVNFLILGLLIGFGLHLIMLVDHIAGFKIVYMVVLDPERKVVINEINTKNK